MVSRIENLGAFDFLLSRFCCGYSLRKALLMCLYSDGVGMSLWQLKDGEDTVSEEPQCVSPRGRASAEENLLWGYRYGHPCFFEFSIGA
jgi:hypothetical protein